MVTERLENFTLSVLALLGATVLFGSIIVEPDPITILFVALAVLPAAMIISYFLHYRHDISWI